MSAAGLLIALLTLLIGAGGAAIGWSRLTARRARAGWADASLELGLELETARPLALKLSGQLDGHDVSVSTTGSAARAAPWPWRAGRSEQRQTRFVVRSHDIPRQLRIRPVALSQAGDEEELPTGDDAFDQTYAVEGGTAAERVRLLTSELRSRLLAPLMRKGHLEVTGGGVRFIAPGVVTRAKDLSRLVNRLVEIADQLAAKARQPPALGLLENSRSEPHPLVRARNVFELLELGPDCAQAVEGARLALDSENAAIRLAAARFLGPEGAPTLEALAYSRRVSGELRVEAWQTMLERVPDAEKADHVRRALESEVLVRVALAEAVEHELSEVVPDLRLRIRTLRRAGTSRELEHLRTAGVLLITPDDIAPELSDPAGLAYYVEALGELGGPEHQDEILELLRHPSPTVRVAAVSALGGIGELRVVEVLQKLVKDSLIGSQIRRVAADSVKRIQARHGTEGEGGLSLASEPDPEAGKLSLTPAPGGLSEPADEPPVGTESSPSGQGLGET